MKQIKLVAKTARQTRSIFYDRNVFSDCRLRSLVRGDKSRDGVEFQRRGDGFRPSSLYFALCCEEKLMKRVKIFL